jgi:flagellar FliL protein
MSAAAAAATTDVAVPIKAGKRKKLILIGAVALLVLLLAGAATALWLKNRAAHALDDAGDDEVALQFKGAKPDPAHPPTFLPLDIFVVNLADRDADRYAQVGLTLEVDNVAFAEQMKAYMPAIRNAILMILAHKTSHELLERAGKEQLAAEIMRETVRPMGITIAAPRKAAPAPVDGSLTELPTKKSKAAAQGPHNPVRNVHFSNFIIQ